jgi:hypothetical protein
MPRRQRGSGGIASSFLTSVLYRSEGLASRPGRFAPGMDCRRWTPEAVWTMRSREKSIPSAENWTPAVQLVARRYIDRDISILNKWPKMKRRYQTLGYILFKMNANSLQRKSELLELWSPFDCDFNSHPQHLSLHPIFSAQQLTVDSVSVELSKRFVVQNLIKLNVQLTSITL